MQGRMAFRMEQRLVQELSELALKEGRTPSELIREAVLMYLAKRSR